MSSSLEHSLSRCSLSLDCLGFQDETYSSNIFSSRPVAGDDDINDDSDTDIDDSNSNDNAAAVITSDMLDDDFPTMIDSVSIEDILADKILRVASHVSAFFPRATTNAHARLKAHAILSGLYFRFLQVPGNYSLPVPLIAEILRQGVLHLQTSLSAPTTLQARTLPTYDKTCVSYVQNLARNDVKDAVFYVMMEQGLDAAQSLVRLLFRQHTLLPLRLSDKTFEPLLGILGYQNPFSATRPLSRGVFCQKDLDAVNFMGQQLVSFYLSLPYSGLDPLVAEELESIF